MDMQSEEFRQAVNAELGSLALEGLSPDAETLADLEMVIQGKMTFEQVKNNISARIRNGKV